MKDVFPNIIRVANLHCLCLSNYHVVHLNLKYVICQLYLCKAERTDGSKMTVLLNLLLLFLFVCLFYSLALADQILCAMQCLCRLWSSVVGIRFTMAPLLASLGSSLLPTGSAIPQLACCCCNTLNPVSPNYTDEISLDKFIEYHAWTISLIPQLCNSG